MVKPAIINGKVQNIELIIVKINPNIKIEAKKQKQLKEDS